MHDAGQDRARRRRGAQQAETFRTGVEQRRERGQQRHRAAEQHREQIERHRRRAASARSRRSGCRCCRLSPSGTSSAGGAGRARCVDRQRSPRARSAIATITAHVRRRRPAESVQQSAGRRSRHRREMPRSTSATPPRSDRARAARPSADSANTAGRMKLRAVALSAMTRYTGQTRSARIAPGVERQQQQRDRGQDHARTSRRCRACAAPRDPPHAPRTAPPPMYGSASASPIRPERQRIARQLEHLPAHHHDLRLARDRQRAVRQQEPAEVGDAQRRVGGERHRRRSVTVSVARSVHADADLLLTWSTQTGKYG